MWSIRRSHQARLWHIETAEGPLSNSCRHRPADDPSAAAKEGPQKPGVLAITLPDDTRAIPASGYAQKRTSCGSTAMPIADIRKMKQHALMLSFTRASWPLVAATAIISGGAGWVAAEVMRSPHKAGSEIVTTVAQVRSRPDDYAGKRVRLTGQLDECYQWECSLCPEGMTSKSRNADRCLAISFRPLVNDTGFGSDEQESVFRFSSVSLSAKFDPSCWKGGCLDRQTVLEDATVNRVTKRRAGASGLWITDTNKLVRLEGAIANEIVAAARRSGYPGNPPIRAFATSGSEPRLVVCWSFPAFGEQDPGAWPLTLESALYARSTLDFFRCNEVRKADGQMVVQANA